MPAACIQFGSAMELQDVITVNVHSNHLVQPVCQPKDAYIGSMIRHAYVHSDTVTVSDTVSESHALSQ